MTEQTSIGANDGIIVTTVGATPSSGPFAIDFPFDNLDDVIVTTTTALGVQTVLARGLDYTIAATVNGDGLYPSGTLTLVAPVANVALARWRSTPLERSSQLPLTGYLDRAALNSDLNRVMMAMQDFDRRYGQYIRLPEGDSVVDAVVPPRSVRANNAFIWDSAGNPSAGVLVSTSLVLNTYWRDSVLPTTTPSAARAVLFAAGINDPNVFSDPNTFNANAIFHGGATFNTVFPTTITPGANDDSNTIANTRWVQDLIDARLTGASALTTVPTIVELTSGTGTWTVPAGVKWFDVEMIGGGGGGGSNIAGSNGNATSFGGISVAGGSGGTQFPTRSGGTGGTGGTGTGTATTLIRRGGAHGGPGVPATELAGPTYESAGGNGAAGPFGGAPGKGGVLGAGTAGSPNSGAGGGGYGNQDINGGAGGGGAGESALLRYATVAASYAYTVGAGAAGAAGNSAGGSGYIRIRCHFNY